MKSSKLWKMRPGAKLRFRYFTPDSTLPLVCARYGWHSRGVKPQWRAKASKVVLNFGRLRPVSSTVLPSTTVRMRSYSSVSQRPPKWAKAFSCAASRSGMRSRRKPSA